MQSNLVFEEELLKEEVFRWEHSESEKGQIYTRPKVINFMLECIGLSDSDTLLSSRILEPSCGEGEFVVLIAERLISSCNPRPSVDQLLGRVLAIDLVGASIDVAKSKVFVLLTGSGYSEEDAKLVLEDWFTTGDFLLTDLEANFTHVIGNPPYVRVENIPKNLLSEYRSRFLTMADRADLYVPFFEKSLSLLRDGGRLSFICTDRWTKNTYGKSLRKLIHDFFWLELFVDLYGKDAFERDVMTYPAITQIRKAKADKTVLLLETNFAPEEAEVVVKALQGLPTKKNAQVRNGIVNGSNPWLLGKQNETALIRRLELQYPTLEEVGCEVLIGAATGANAVYIIDRHEIDIEDSRLLPVITAKELKTGEIQWQGKYLINTYDEEGVISLHEYPKLQSYLNKHKDLLCKRHVAKNSSDRWFRTIDRVYESRARSEKLLIPDIGSDPIVVLDAGEFHPNNSIYYICSKSWDLRALRVVLLSSITRLFVSSYSTKIANGFLRYQAQHLRRIRLPRWDSVDRKLKERLIAAGIENDSSCYSTLAAQLYGLSDSDRSTLGE